jgi:hypothetical protein
MEAIRDQIIYEYVFNRIRDYGYADRFAFKTYKEFMEWQQKCLAEMSGDDYNWISGLCRRIRNGKIRLMDEETCVDFEAGIMYFDANRNIVIINPR